MAKELTFSSATLGWRFAHTEIFLKNFIKQWELLQDVQIKNLDEYWNINAASGEWLKQIGAVFHVDKPQVLSGNAFILDIDMMDDPSVFLDGTNEDIADDIFRKVIILRSISTMKLFSIKNIADNLYEAFGSDQIKVEIFENTDVNGNYKERYFRLLLTFKDTEMIKLFIGLQETFPLILIGKPMGVSYDIYVEHDPNLGRGADAILCGEPDAASSIAQTYYGSDSSITDPADCYSYDGSHFTMYFNYNTTILSGTWTPVYKNKDLTTIVAYVKKVGAGDITPIPTGARNKYTTNGEVYFPSLGETESDARSSFILRAKTQE